MSEGAGEGIGARLKVARERAGLTWIEVAEKLHVDPQAIEALEAENFAYFGASVYVHGHIRNYAGLVGESPAELKALYATSSRAVRAPDLTQVPHARSIAGSPAALAPGLAIMACVALVGSGWWLAGSFQEHRAAVRSAPATGKVLALKLHFAEDSWAEVYDGRGARLLFDVGAADSTRTVSGTAPLKVVLGNPTGVALELNGRPVNVPAGAARNVTIEFEINRYGGVAPPRLAAAEARNH